MTTKVSLQVKLRSEMGKGASRSLRRQGLVPGVIYGHGEATRACAVETKQLERLLATVSHESTLIDLKLDNGDSSRVLIRELQVHPFRPEILHVDFLSVRKGEKVKLEVPVRLVGVAPGVKEGGIMEHLRHEIEIRCDPDLIPEALDLDISALAIGDALTVASLQVPSGVEVLEDETASIVAVVPPSVHKVPEAEVEAEAVEEEVEPEVVGRGKPAVEEEAGETQEQ